MSIEGSALPQGLTPDEVLAKPGHLNTLYRIGATVAAELDLQKIVQTVTDEATALTGAEFGAFFYNVISDGGEAYMLYTLSGVPREAFSKFPMPRNTEIFDPTFRGLGVVRLDDVLADPRVREECAVPRNAEGAPSGAQLSCRSRRLTFARGARRVVLRSLANRDVYRGARASRVRRGRLGGAGD